MHAVESAGHVFQQLAAFAGQLSEQLRTPAVLLTHVQRLSGVLMQESQPLKLEQAGGGVGVLTHCEEEQ